MADDNISHNGGPPKLPPIWPVVIENWLDDIDACVRDINNGRNVLQANWMHLQEADRAVRRDTVADLMGAASALQRLLSAYVNVKINTWED